MKRTRVAIALLIGTMGVAEPSVAQVANSMGSGTSENERAVRTPDPTSFRARLDHAHELAVQGKFVAARREYAAVARDQKRIGQLPDEALWWVAALYSGEQQRERAVAALDELAEAAETHGHPVVQAKALIEAAVIYQQLGQPAEAAARIERLEPLLSSPFLPESLRSSISDRLVRG